MKIDISKDLYCIDKWDKRTYKVTGVFFPLGKPSGKDITIEIEKDLDEWRAIDEVELIQNVK